MAAAVIRAATMRNAAEKLARRSGARYSRGDDMVRSDKIGEEERRQ
jgi:hypothetical protein